MCNARNVKFGSKDDIIVLQFKIWNLVVDREFSGKFLYLTTHFTFLKEI